MIIGCRAMDSGELTMDNKFIIKIDCKKNPLTIFKKVNCLIDTPHLTYRLKVRILGSPTRR